MKRERKRELADLISIGPATLADLKILGIESVEDLAREDAQALYERLCRMTRTWRDPCCEDVFRAAIAQARNPRLPQRRCKWWYWSRVRNRTS